MYTLYGKQGSGSATTQIALEMLGAPYRVVETASWEPNDAFQELLQVNPLGQIPTLVLPDGSVLSESAAILIHLGSVYPDSGLLPRDPSARAQAVRGMVFIAANCYAAISVIDFPERWCADADNDDAVKDRFPAAPYLGGEELGALDIHAAVVSKWSGARKHLEAHRPELHAALMRIEAHPKVAAVFAEHWPKT
jgi:GST-like protein